MARDHYTELKSFLLADEEIQSLLGGPDSIYLVRAPQESPGAAFLLISQLYGTPNGTHDDASSNEMRAYQLTCYGPTMEQACALRDRCVAVLDNARLPTSNDSPSLIDDGREVSDEVIGMYRADADFLV